jgi:hypothetical protein
MQRGHPKPLCILFSDTEGIQWVDTDARVVKSPPKALEVTKPVNMGTKTGLTEGPDLPNLNLCW